MFEPEHILTEGINILTNATWSQPAVVASIAQTHISCITHDNIMATFLPPLDFDKVSEYWTTLIDEATDNKRLILIYVSKLADRSSHHVTGELSGTSPSFASLKVLENHKEPIITLVNKSGGWTHFEVSGVVSLTMPYSETGLFRGVMENLFVSPCHRRRGIAKKLVNELEDCACEAGRWNVMVHAGVGTVSEELFRQLEYTELGVVKDYGYLPRNGKLADAVFFWRDLRKRPVCID